MSKDFIDKITIGQIVCSIFSLFPIILILGIMLTWQQSTIQAEVWRRQGVEITTWEVFMGARPLFDLKGNK